MLNKKTFIISLIFLGFSGFGFSSQAILISQVNFINFSMEKASLTAGEEIRGDFTLKNYENEVVPDITYGYRLLAKDSDGFYTVILDEQFSGDNFSLGSNQKITKSFSYKLPQNLPSGNHRFRVWLSNSKGILMSRKDSDIIIQSDDRFLTLENHFLLKEDQRLLPKGEAVYEAGQTPRIVFDISNESSFQISASPRMAFYYYNVTENPFQTVEKQNIILSPGESQNQTFDLPDFKEPGIYLCRVALYEDNNVVSNSIDFGWTVSGKEFEVIQFRTDRSFYESGDEAIVVVYLANVVAFPMEKDGELQVKMFDEKGRIAGEKTEKVSFEEGRVEVRIPITKNVINPRVEITVLDENQQIVEKYQTQMKDESLIEQEIIEEERPEERSGVFLAVTILVILVIAFLIYIFKKRSSVSKAVFIIFIFGGIFFLTNPASAFVVMSSSGPGSTVKLSWTSPLPAPDYVHEANSYVQYRGDISLISKANIQNAKIDFFISSNEDVKLKDYDTGPNIIKVINEDESDLVKLGEIYLLPGTELSYNEVFHIPENIAYIGEEAARFYLQFKGKSGGIWYWYIAHREATIQPYGEGGLVVNLEAHPTEAPVGEEIDWTLEINNLHPCIGVEADVMLVIDVSGSMGTEKMNDAEYAAETFVKGMSPAYHQIGVVSYSTTASLKHALSVNHDTVISSIKTLSSGGTTCISCGVEVAYQEILTNGRPDVPNYMLFMTDGLANRPYTGGINCHDCRSYSADYAIEKTEEAEDAIIYTIGFGSTASGIPPGICCDASLTPGNPSSCCGLLNSMADIGGGSYFYAPGGEELTDIYKAIGGIISGASIDTKVEINIPDELEVTDYDDRCELTGNKLICDVGTLGCGGGTHVEPFTFTTEIISGQAGQQIEVEATVSNLGGKEKKSTRSIKIMSRPTAEIISPDAGTWQTGRDAEGNFIGYFEASFKYTDDIDGPGLDVCEYRVESKPADIGTWSFIETVEPWTSYTKSQWGGRDPYNTYYPESRAQFIILKSELNELGFYGGEITSFHLEAAQVPGRSLADFRIRLKHTDKTAVTAWEGGWTYCFGPSTVSREDLTIGEWKEYVCASPFSWNGNDNLMVDFSRHDTGYHTTAGGMYRRNIGQANRMFSGVCSGCTLYAQTSGTTYRHIYNFVPAIKLNVTIGEEDDYSTVPWTSAGDCSGEKDIELFKEITVGEGQDCRHEGEDTCRISVRATDVFGVESAKTGEWQRVYYIDWTPPDIEIK